MAWEDRTPFEAIKFQFGLAEADVKALMKKESLDMEKATQLFLLGKQPTGRFVEASHIADMLVFLCGPAGRDITGAILPVEGGWLAV
jgi:3-hydroxybutyrate dehydrogenase